jgi:phosphatidylserine/phosphatidylglycerophosphate/cardiolipin synthase-like enzyme
MFGLSDPAILHALAQKKVTSTIHFDPTGTPHLWSALPKATLHPAHGKGLMHQKICVLDQETVFLGSANMTTPSLLMHDNLVIGLKHRGVAQFLIDHAPHTSAHFRTSVGGQDFEIWLLPDPQGEALHQIQKAIRSAKRTVQIALFTFTYPPLVEEVIQAHRRGLKVTVLLDFHSALGASHKTVELLEKAGIEVLVSKGLQLLHHKFVWLDGETLFTGSANWTKAAFYRNRDCVLALHQLTEEQTLFLRRLWHRMQAEANPLRK